MQIDHIGLYVTDLEKARLFFEKYFDATANKKYTNPRKGFSSYFLSFADGSRLEIMTREGQEGQRALGGCHISFSVGGKEAVDHLTKRLQQEGFEVADEPRMTGDGSYESCIVGIDGNLIEITE